MANKVYFSVSIADEISPEEMMGYLGEATAAAFEEIAIYAEGFAALACPVDTGNLRSSITHTSDEKHAVIGTNVEYAPYVEMGHRQYGSGKVVPAQPYLRPALENHLPLYQDVLTQHLKG